MGWFVGVTKVYTFRQYDRCSNNRYGIGSKTLAVDHRLPVDCFHKFDHNNDGNCHLGIDKVDGGTNGSNGDPHKDNGHHPYDNIHFPNDMAGQMSQSP